MRSAGVPTRANVHLIDGGPIRSRIRWWIPAAPMTKLYLALALTDDLALHANLGANAVFGRQTLFTTDVRIDDFVHGGVGAVVRALPWLDVGVQVEGNTSLFSDVPFLDGPVLTCGAGLRCSCGRGKTLELGVERGLTRLSADFEVFVQFGLVF